MSGTSVHVAPAKSVQGEVHLPGDKSISHRALLLALVSTKPVRIENLATGDDVQRTLRVVEQLGATVERDEQNPTNVTVTGVGLDGIQPPADGTPIDCGNAGTLVRLLAGLLAAQPAGREFTLVGDDSLSSRPMRRIAEPLSELGARVSTEPDGTLPMRIVSGAPLHGGTFELPVASAQVQSAILLAGLRAEQPVTVIEPGAIRDHTERALRRAGAKVVRRSGSGDDARARVTLEPVERIELPSRTRIPADPSSAAFLITAATVLHGSMLRLPGLLDNGGRNGFVDVLEQMGARFAWSNRGELDGEQVADLEVGHAVISKTFVEIDDIVRMIDELPIFALAAHFRKGETVIRGAEELRAKESDRIEVLSLALRRIGVSCQPLQDGFIIRGSSVRPDGGTMDAAGDHRLAMVGGIAGLVSRRGVTIENAECVDVSFPGFFDLLEAIAVR